MSESDLHHHHTERVSTRGAPFTSVVLDDRYAYLSGIVAADIPNSNAVLGDVAAETALVMDTVRDILAELGLALDRIVRIDLHMADFDEFPEMNDVYRSYFESGFYPARTSTQSTKLFGDCRVEITCIARR